MRAARSGTFLFGRQFLAGLALGLLARQFVFNILSVQNVLLLFQSRVFRDEFFKSVLLKMDG